MPAVASHSHAETIPYWLSIMDDRDKPFDVAYLGDEFDFQTEFCRSFEISGTETDVGLQYEDSASPLALLSPLSKPQETDEFDTLLPADNSLLSEGLLFESDTSAATSNDAVGIADWIEKDDNSLQTESGPSAGDRRDRGSGHLLRKPTRIIKTHPQSFSDFLSSQSLNSTALSLGSGGGGKRPYSIGDSNSKNAIAARDNRLKKKRYIASLEDSVRNLRTENERLLKQTEKNKSLVSKLQTEVTYLRNVIANQSTLSAILKNVANTPGIKLSTSFGHSPQISLTKSGNDVKTSHAVENRSYTGASTTYPSTHSSASSEEDSVSSSCMGVQTNLPELFPISGGSLTTRSRSTKAVKRFSVLEPKEKIVKKKLGRRNCSAISASYPKMKTKSHNKQESTHLIVDVEQSDYSDSDTSDGSPSFASTLSGHENAGICLHVSGQNVSLEFCAHCNSSAYAGIMSDHSYVKQ